MSDKITLRSLEEELEEVLEDEKEEILSDKYPEDRLSEIVDGVVPVYNSDLLEVAGDELWLAVETPETVGNAGGAIGQIQGNIYEHLNGLACKWLEEAQEEREEASK